VRGLLFPEYVASYATAPGLVSPLMFLLFAAIPTIVARAGRNRVGGNPLAVARATMAP